MENEINSYDLLGVKKDSSREDILEAYVSLKHNLFLNKQQDKITEEDYKMELTKLNNAYNSIINNNVVEIIDSKDKIENSDLIEKINLQDVKEEATSKELEKDLNNAIETHDASIITVKRGRLIKKIKEEIKKIKKSGELTSQDDIDDLKRLEELLAEQIYEHKKQLSERYKEEFLDKPATVKAIFTVFPKGLGLQVKKISNCINELKQAKSNKERIFGIVDLAKSIGLLTATPVIFTTKFIIKHWYLLLLLLTLIPNLHLPKWFKNKSDKKSNDDKIDGELEMETVTEPEINVIKQGVGETEKVLDNNNSTLHIPVKETIPNNTPKTIVPNTDYINDTSVNTNVSNQEYSGIDLTDKYFQLVRESLPPIITKYNTIFNTYQDAVNYCINELHYSPEQTEKMLNNGFSSIKWLVGKNGLVAGSNLELLQNYSMEQLQEMANSNQNVIAAALEMQKLGKNFSEICATLGAEGTIAFIAYELLQYGLAIPTEGMSLLMPG